MTANRTASVNGNDGTTASSPNSAAASLNQQQISDGEDLAPPPTVRSTEIQVTIRVNS
jgi:hypothetical protein